MVALNLERYRSTSRINKNIIDNQSAVRLIRNPEFHNSQSNEIYWRPFPSHTEKICQSRNYCRIYLYGQLISWYINQITPSDEIWKSSLSD